jgi:hypothetical protein
MSIDPVPCIAMFSPSDSSLLVYSMTGQLLAEKKLKTTLQKMQLMADSDGCDVLVLLDQVSCLSFFKLPFLDEAKKRIKMKRLGLVDLVTSQQSLILSTDSEIIVCQ